MVERVVVQNARGESYPDVLRRTGQFGVSPTDTDAEAVAKLNADAAASAAAAEAVSGPTYASIAAGLAGTVSGESFAVNNGDGTVTIYLNDGGTADPQRTLATTAYLLENGGTAVEVEALGRRRQLASVVTDHGYDATWDVLEARSKPGWNGDQDALNIVAATYANWCLNPMVGVIDARAEIVVPLANPRIIGLGGKQGIGIARHPTHTGHTMRIGAPDSGGGGVCIENLFFTHEGRVGYSGGGSLPGVKLTNNQAHLMVYRAQGGKIANVGGWGAVHMIRLMECNIVTLKDIFSFGGVWDPDFTAAQEGISVINLATGPNSGHNTSIMIESSALYGASVGNRSVSIGGITVTAPRRAGPLNGILVNSCEDWHVTDTLLASFADSAIKWAPDSVKSYNVNGQIIGCNIDESNLDCVSVIRSDASWGTPDTLIMKGNTLNGQLVSRNALSVYQGAGGIISLQDFQFVDNVCRATLGAALRLFAVKGGFVRGNSFRGYNVAYTDDVEQSSGVVLSGSTSNIDISDNRFGGGINSYEDGGTPNSNGLSANGCKYGLYRGQNLAAITGSRFHQMPFGKTGGTLLARRLDTGDYTFDPTQVLDAPTFAG